jgi:hypothetical protein
MSRARVNRVVITTRDLWTGKRGIEISDGNWRCIRIGFGEPVLIRLRKKAAR